MTHNSGPEHEQAAVKGSCMAQSRVPPKLSLIDRLELAMSTGHTVDGLWIGASVDDSQVAMTLGRLEAALSLIKTHDPRRYHRLLQDCSRVWVRLLPGNRARFKRASRACELDTRFALDESVSIPKIASVIIHEATHARLVSRGITYDEAQRRRIELVCRRQELTFALRVPDTNELQEQLRSWLNAPPEASLWTDSALAQARIDGVEAGLLHLGVSKWAVILLKSFGRTVRWLRGAA
jgi:hypothetical protein